MPRKRGWAAACTPPQTLAKEQTMSDMREDMLKRLTKQRASKLERSNALWKMSADERVAAMRRDELTWGQLYEWASCKTRAGCSCG